MCLHPGMNIGELSDQEIRSNIDYYQDDLKYEQEVTKEAYYISYYKGRIEWLQRELDRREAERNVVVDEEKEAEIMAYLAKFTPVSV